MKLNVLASAIPMIAISALCLGEIPNHAIDYCVRDSRFTGRTWDGGYQYEFGSGTFVAERENHVAVLSNHHVTLGS